MTIQELLPECNVTDDEITWITGNYVHVYKGQNAELDGEFTSVQLRAIADWMESPLREDK